jgi:hypothetical protein
MAILSGTPGNLFNLIKGMQMVRNKKISVGLALIVGVLGMSVGSSAVVAPQPVNTVDSDAAEPAVVDEQAHAS